MGEEVVEADLKGCGRSRPPSEDKEWHGQVALEWSLELPLLN